MSVTVQHMAPLKGTADRRHLSRGSVIVVSYFTISVLLILAIPQTIRSISSVRLESKFLNHRQSMQLAEAGLDNAMKQLAGSTSLPPIVPQSNTEMYRFGTVVPCPVTIPATTCSQDPSLTNNSYATLPPPLPTDPIGRYEATLTGPTSGSLGNMWTIQAIGTSPSGTPQTVRAMVKRVVKPFQGIHANANVNLGVDARVDSYDSRLGNHQYGGTYTDSSGVTQTNQADHVSVEVNTGTVTLGGTSQISGKAGTPTGTVVGNSPSLGTYVDTPIIYPDWTPPAAPLCDAAHTNILGGAFADGGNHTYSDAVPYCFTTPLVITASTTVEFPNAPYLYINGQLLISSGRLHWGKGAIQATGGFSISASWSTLSVTGPTEFYVIGPVVVDQGADVNRNGGVGGLPPNLILYAKKSTATDAIHFSGVGTEFWGAIYAPGMDVTIDQNNSISAAIIANNITISGTSSAVHFDEALRDVTIGTSGITAGETVIPPTAKVPATVTVRGIRYE